MPLAAAGLLQEIEDPVGSAMRCGLDMASTLIDEVRAGVHAGSRMPVSHQIRSRCLLRHPVDLSPGSREVCF